jgi:hypothetical protein
MTGDNEMQIPKPRLGSFEINLNSILNMITLLSLIGGGGWIWANTTRDIDELQSWKLSATAHSDVLEARVDKVEAQVNNHEYRINMGEQSNANTAGSIKEFQSVLNQQSGDLREVKVILQRIEAAQKGAN